MDELLFTLNQAVTIVVSGERGTVCARAQYANGAEPGYLVFYKAADGRAVSAWFDQSQLEATPESEVKTG